MDEPPALAMPASRFAFLAKGGEMGALMRSHDWAATPLGPVEVWPQSLRSAVGTCLNCGFPILLWWGPDLVMIYNDEYRPILGADKHPRALGAPGAQIWPEVWDVIGPMLRQVMERGEATRSRDLLLTLERNGFQEECFFSFSYSPIHDEGGGIGGVFCPVIETTEKVVSERRLRVLSELGARMQAVHDAVEACTSAIAILATDPADVPFALAYLTEEDGSAASLVAATGLPEGHPTASPRIALTGPEPTVWPLGGITAQDGSCSLSIAAELAPLPGGPWPDPTREVLALPFAAPGEARPSGFLIVGVSPRRPFDAPYRSFLELAAGHVATAITNARSYEAERRRAEALAELDRAKTAFFSNVSHEFRTPLTLMLGPLEEALADPGGLSPHGRGLIEVAHRNGLRLLRLVNTLLDFSRVEAGRAQAHFVPTDLATLTRDIASAFRSACEKAGLRLEVDCPPLPGPVSVDPEMWEKIVLNLLSNAFKFTFAGSIAVGLRAVEGVAELTVRDTGTGIPAHELPRLFDRFHRVENAVGRTHEGSGIGLALVQDLARLHGGTVSVASQPGQGSTFTVRLPLGAAQAGAHESMSPPDQARVRHAAAYVEEVLRWLPEDVAPVVAPDSGTAEALPVGDAVAGARILVVDDNADLRAYLRRLLLTAGYRVEMAVDGAAALAQALDNPPDLVLSDVMMPRLDGFGLLRALRAEPRTRELPVLLLSARAGEEAEVEGLDAGADDYLVKPFSARELLARVGASLRLARLRQEVRETRREADARWHSFLERMQEGFFLCELVRDAEGRAVDFRFLEVSGGWERMTGIPAHAVIGRRAQADLFPDLEEDWLATYTRVAETGEPARFEGYAAPLSRWYEVVAYQTGPDRFGALFLDITSRRLASDRQALLTREVNHRAKNVLAVVQSVVRMTRAAGVREYAEAVEGRVAALARAHELLARDQWQGAELRVVVEEELSAYGGSGRITLSGPPVRLQQEAVQPLSMVLHELTTNAAKYGAFAYPAGRVDVSWWFEAPAGPLHLCWRESGGPPIIAPPQRRGFGSSLIAALVKGQLGGPLEMRWLPEGLVCELVLAAEHLSAPAGEVEGNAFPLGSTGALSIPAALSLEGRTVLLVEDEALVAMEVVQTLSALGCRVVGPASRLEEGLRLARETVAQLSAAVLDVNLHGRSGAPVAEFLTRHAVPVIWATGYGELPPGLAAEAGWELLRKPLAQGELEAALRRAIARAQASPMPALNTPPA